jgi:hypothetical protein
LEGWDHVEGHIGWLFAEAEVDVDEGSCMALEPAWLKGDCAASHRPFGSVARGWHAAAWSNDQ